MQSCVLNYSLKKEKKKKKNKREDLCQLWNVCRRVLEFCVRDTPDAGTAGVSREGSIRTNLNTFSHL